MSGSLKAFCPTLCSIKASIKHTFSITQSHLGVSEDQGYLILGSFYKDPTTQSTQGPLFLGPPLCSGIVLPMAQPISPSCVCVWVCKPCNPGPRTNRRSPFRRPINPKPYDPKRPNLHKLEDPETYPETLTPSRAYGTLPKTLHRSLT